MDNIINSPVVIRPMNGTMLIVFSIIFLFAGSYQPLSGQQLFVRSFPQAGQNFQIAQDKQGIIYVTNTEGLLTYDGTDWDLLLMPDHLSTISIATDSTEKIYVGSTGELGYFIKDSTGGYAYTSLLPELDEKYRQVGNVHGVEILKGSVFFFDEQHIYVYTKGHFNVLNIETSTAWSIFVVGDHLYILNMDHELFEYTEAGLLKLDLKKDFKIWDMVSYKQNKGLALDENGRIWLFDTSDPTGKWEQFPESYLNEHEKIKIHQIKYIQDNQIALFTIKGIQFINERGEIIVRLNEKNLSYEDFFLDANHNLWIACTSGIFLISTSSPFSYYNDQEGLEEYIFAFAKKGDYRYVGTDHGLYFQKGRSGFTLLPETSQPIGGVWSFYNSGQQLYAAHNTGVFEVIGEKTKKIIDHFYVMSLCGTAQDSSALIMGTYNTGIWLLKKQSGKWKKSKIEGFDEYSRHMQTDQNGNIWVSDDTKGLWKLQLNNQMDSVVSQEFYNVEKGLPSNVNNRIYRLNNGRLIVTTANGVYSYNKENDRFEPEVKINRALGKNVCIYSLTETPEGDIYFWGMITPGEATAGLLKKQTDGHYNLITTPFKKIAEPIRESSVDVDAPLLLISEEELWLGNRQRLISYNPNQQTFHNDTARTHIKQVWAKDSLIHSNWQVKRKHILPYSKNTMHFQFTSTFSESAEKLRYQYKLEGFEDNWSAWSPLGKAIFTNLHEGNYTFMVRTKNVYDNVGDPVYFKFHIKPPWYRALWAYLMYFSLAALFVYMLIRMKTKRVERQKLLLQQEVNEKTKELLTMNEEITAINEDIHKKNQEIATQAEELRELNFTKDKIFSVISHDLRSSVKQIPELLNLFDSGYITVDEFTACLPNLKDASKNLSNLTDNLLHWAKCQMKGIEIKRSDFKLIDVIDESIRLLKSQAEKKNLQLNTVADEEQHVFADKDMIRLLLRNLIGNAVKFTPENGEITVKSQLKEDFIYVSVIDTGVGLTDEEIDKILSKKFFTKYGTAGEKGSGLGLMLCKEFAELHGGNLFIEGVPGKGSTFTFTIPVYPPEDISMA